MHLSYDGVYFFHICLFPFPICCSHSRYPTFRRQVSLIQPSDVIITNIRNNAQGVLEFEMYIQVAGGAQVLAAEVLESAVQVTVRFFCVCLVLYLFTVIIEIRNFRLLNISDTRSHVK